MAQPQDQRPYAGMTVTKDLRPILHRAGFKNINRFKRTELVRICEEFDRVNDVRIRDLPNDYQPSEAMAQVREIIIAGLFGGKVSNQTSTSSVQDSSRTNNKRKNTGAAMPHESKRNKFSNGENNDRMGSEAEDQNADSGVRHDVEQDPVSETNAQASNHEERQTAHKSDKTKKNLRNSKPSSSRNGGPTSAAGTDTATKTSKRAKTPVTSKVKPSQEPTRKSSRIKNTMNASQPLGEESRNPQTKSTTPRVKNTSAPAADGSSPSGAHEVQYNGRRPKDNTDDSNEKQGVESTNKTPAQRTPHNLHLGTHKVVRYELPWDPLDDRISTSSLTWFEQVERQRARQAMLRRQTEAGLSIEPDTTEHQTEGWMC